MIRFIMQRTNAKILLLLLILVFGLFTRIGYAYLNRDLTINGLAVVSKHNLNIHFVENSIVSDTTHLDGCNGEDTCSRISKTPTIREDGPSIDFGVIFHVVGDYYEFTADVINNGAVDAMLNEVIKEGLNEYSDYLDFAVTYSDGMPIEKYDQLLKNGGTEKIKVRVTLKNTPANDINANLGITINYLRADDNMKKRAISPEAKIRSLNTLGLTIADDDPDGNLRFIGANPNNYVLFNGQKWRIIGIFDGKLKIIQDPIGNYSWDTSKNDVNNGYGINQWGASGEYMGSDLMKLLNPGYENNTDLKCNGTVTVANGIINCGDNTDSNYTTGLVNNSLYWNASSGICYDNGNHSVKTCNFTSIGLKDDTSKNMIEDATWYLGTLNATTGNIWDGRVTANLLYNWERSNDSSKQCTSGPYCNDSVDRTLTWQGKVGLIYPSDYAYATSGGTKYNRTACLSYTVGYVSDNSIRNWQNTYTDCKNNDWLLNTSMWSWTISPRAGASRPSVVFSVQDIGHVNDHGAVEAGAIRPVVFLKSKVGFTDTGNGTQSNPYVLTISE